MLDKVREKREEAIGLYLDEAPETMRDDDKWDPYSVSGLAESIIECMNTPISECSTELEW